MYRLGDIAICYVPTTLAVLAVLTLWGAWRLFKARRRGWRVPGLVLAGLAPLLMAATVTGIPLVLNNAQLGLLPSFQYAAVLRLGVDTPGDAPPQWFMPSTAACSISGGDVGSQVPAVDGGCFNAAPATGPRDLRQWVGGRCDNVTDASPRINAALASGASAIVGPAGQICAVLSQTIALPDDVNFYWPDPLMNPNGQKSGLRCGPGVSLCVKAGQGHNHSPNIHDIDIFQSGPPTGTTCIQWYGTANVTPHDIWCQNFAIAYRIASVGTAGIGFHGTNLYTCQSHDADVDIVSEPGVYFQGGWLGCNGAFDVNKPAYVRIEGNWDQAKGTIHFNDVQFNQGQNAVTCGFSLQNFTGTTNVIADLEIIGGHLETADNYLCTDATVLGLSTFQVIGQFTVGGWGGTNHFLALDPATQPSFWQIANNTLFGWGDVTINPTKGFSVLTIAGNHFQQPVSITGSAPTNPSSLTLTDNDFNGNLTLAGTYLIGRVSGNRLGGTYSFSDSALANLNIILDNVPCTAGLAFGGATTGITYVSRMCAAVLANHVLTLRYYLALSNIGTATGAATITGLPFSPGTFGLAMAPVDYTALTGITNSVNAMVQAGTSHILDLMVGGAAALTTLANTNFTNSAILQGQISYVVGAN